MKRKFDIWNGEASSLLDKIVSSGVWFRGWFVCVCVCVCVCVRQRKSNWYKRGEDKEKVESGHGWVWVGGEIREEGGFEFAFESRKRKEESGWKREVGKNDVDVRRCWQKHHGTQRRQTFSHLSSGFLFFFSFFKTPCLIWLLWILTQRSTLLRCQTTQATFWLLLSLTNQSLGCAAGFARE